MENPELSPHHSLNMTARSMFDYDTHQNIPWNFLEYSPEKEYLDPGRQALMRKYASQKKGEKPSFTVTKRGFYMDYDMKVAKSIPGSNAYNMHDSWDGSKERKKSETKKFDPKLIKYTYLERIEIEQKNRKRPGIATYHLEKTEDQIKAEQKKFETKKITHGEKRYFYQDTAYLSNVSPGAGAHNPHDIRKKMSLNKTEPKFWQTKHKKEWEEFSKKKSAEPGAGTYKPLPNLYTTFTHLSELPKDKLEKKNGFGTDEKFAYLREQKVKNKIKEVRPAPDSYNTFIEWPQKTSKEGDTAKHRKNWFNRISHGYSQGVYH